MSLASGLLQLQLGSQWLGNLLLSVTLLQGVETTEREVSYLGDVEAYFLPWIKQIQSEECKSADIFSNVRQDGVLVCFLLILFTFL